MHGTVVMLMALSGLGCHHKHADVVYAPSCYSGVADACYSSCYSSSVIQPACYSSCYSEACYSACYSEACYSACYSGKKHGLFKRAFGHFGGLFKKHHRPAVVESCYSSCYSSCYAETYASCYSACYSGGYSPAVFGSPAPIYETPMSTTPAPAGAGAAPATTAPAPATPPAPAGNDLYRGGQPSIDTPPAPPAPAGAASDAIQGAADAASDAIQGAADAATGAVQGAAGAAESGLNQGGQPIVP